jgi:putative DNA primase/helicase
MAGRSHVYIDNMFTPMDWKRETFVPLDSAALASALTQAVWSDRLLGGNREVQVPVRVVWMGSGNNVEFSPELARRVVPIRLEPLQQKPWEREDFKHKSLRAWATANRAALLVACLTICKRWIDAGMPPGRHTLGSYEDWARVMGGILEAADVPGFLENKTTTAERAADNQCWPLLSKAWHEARGEILTATADVHTIILGDAALQVEFADIIGEGSANSQKKRLGKALARQAGRVWGGLKIDRSSSESFTGNTLWRVRKMEGGTAERPQRAEETF